MNILIVQPNGIGNTILSTPAMQAIRALFPKARFNLLINPLGLPVVEGWSVFDSIISDQLMINAVGYDMVILAEPQGTSRFQFVKAQAAKVLQHPGTGYRTQLLRRSMRHEVLVNMDLAVTLGYKGPFPPLYCNVAPDGAAFDPYRGRIAMHMGSSNTGHAEKKKWPRENWVEIVRQLGPKNVVMVGGPEERGQADAICDETGALSAVGRFSLAEVARLISNSCLLVSIDSGIMHIATAVGTPVVALFGGTSVEKNHPWCTTSKAAVIQARVICAPCQYTPRYKSCDDFLCMRSISAAQVLRTVESMTNGQSPIHDLAVNGMALRQGMMVRCTHAAYDLVNIMASRCRHAIGHADKCCNHYYSGH